jgi:Ca-activated chloride channel family protein
MADTTVRPLVEAPPTLVAKVDERSVPMRVRSCSLDVRIAGPAARTTMVLVFENPHDRVLEGELTFPVPPGSSVCGYGLDVDGEIADASLVPKRKAREVFEAEVRKRADPGLLEQIGGNRFRTRVYPLPARGTRTVRVEIETLLEPRDGEDVLVLPLRFEPPRREVTEEQRSVFTMWSELLDSVRKVEGAPDEGFHVRVEVAKGPSRPVFHDAPDLGFADRGDAWVIETSRADRLPDSLRVGLPAAERPVVLTETFDGETFFLVDLRHEEGPAPEPEPPDRVALLWDASLSRAEADLRLELDLVRELTRRWGSTEVELLALRDTVESVGTFPIVVGEAEALLEAIAGLPHDGGTALGAVDLAGGSADLVLLFTDGVATLGTGEPGLGEARVRVISSAPDADRPALEHLAGRAGGTYVDLRGRTIDQAVEAVVADPVRLLDVEIEGDAEAPGRPQLRDGRLLLSGRLHSKKARLTLVVGRHRERASRISVSLERPRSAGSGVVARRWARERIDELAPRADLHGDALLELGRRFGLVTPNASLLVLETLEQHLEHDVPPAPSRKAMRRAYDSRVKEAERQEETRRVAKLQQVREWWRDRVEWWEREHDPRRFRRRRKARGRATPRETTDDGLGMPDAALGMAMAEEAHPAEMCFCMADAPLASGPAAAPPAPAAAGGGEASAPRATISLRPWNPDTPYLAAMDEAGPDGAYAAYLAQRAEHGRSPGFYLDAADHLFRADRHAEGLRVLSNLAEIERESPALLRILAYKLETENELERARDVLEEVLRLRPEEPQSHRDLALVLDRLGEHRRAAELLWAVVLGEWDFRFPEIETIALLELNRLLARPGCEGLAREIGMEPDLVKLLDQDLRVLLSWDADLVDVDLWVTEPTGEKCVYSHNRTAAGGRLSKDFTQGYGPEEYTIRRGPRGAYRIQAHYYGSSQQTLMGPATILATVFTNYGRPDEERRVMTVRVREVREELDVGVVALD